MNSNKSPKGVAEEAGDGASSIFRFGEEDARSNNVHVKSKVESGVENSEEEEGNVEEDLDFCN